MSAAADSQINYMVHPTRVESISADGSEYEWRDEPALYDDLVLAGYPLSNNETLGGYFIDIAVRGRRVVVFTEKPATEHDMGEVAGLFLAWAIRNDPDCAP